MLGILGKVLRYLREVEGDILRGMLFVFSCVI